MLLRQPVQTLMLADRELIGGRFDTVLARGGKAQGVHAASICDAADEQLRDLPGVAGVQQLF